MKRPLLPTVISLFLLALLFTGCGYRWGSQNASLRSVSIPYAVNDTDGNFTAALVHELATNSSTYQYTDGEGELLLRVTIVDEDEEDIGFRYDREKHEKRTHTLIPSETRLMKTAEFTLEEVSSGCTLLGPVRLSATIDYDHDYYASRNRVNVFSLGQVTNIDEAHDAACRPLNRSLARKIINYIEASF